MVDRGNEDQVRRVINISDLTEKGALFVRGPKGSEWLDYSGLPANALERRIKRPRLSRLRAAWTGVYEAGRSPIISHLPRMTAAVSLAQFVQRNRSPHLAFAFNFTDLPTGGDYRRLRRAFASVDRFCVFSDYERGAYPDIFGLPPERFIRLPWAQRPPAVSAESSPFPAKTYVSAVGGEGRDYATLLEAARRLPHEKFVVVARPWSIQGSVPKNMEVLTNLESSLTWRIVQDSKLMVVPLKSRTTCCGHITIVSAGQLGVPMISSFSEATREYTDDAVLYEAGNSAELAERIDHGSRNWEELADRAMERRAMKVAKYDRELWEAPITEFLEDAWRR